MKFGALTVMPAAFNECVWTSEKTSVGKLLTATCSPAVEPDYTSWRSGFVLLAQPWAANVLEQWMLQPCYPSKA